MIWLYDNITFYHNPDLDPFRDTVKLETCDLFLTKIAMITVPAPMKIATTQKKMAKTSPIFKLESEFIMDKWLHGYKN